MQDEMTGREMHDPEAVVGQGSTLADEIAAESSVHSRAGAGEGRAGPVAGPAGAAAGRVR